MNKKSDKMLRAPLPPAAPPKGIPLLDPAILLAEISVIVFLAHLFSFGSLAIVIVPDEFIYMNAAHGVAPGLPDFSITPFIVGLLSNWEASYQTYLAWNALFVTLCLPVTYVFLREFHSEWRAFALTCILALWPPFWIYPRFAMLESSFILAGLVAAYCLFKGGNLGSLLAIAVKPLGLAFPLSLAGWRVHAALAIIIGAAILCGMPFFSQALPLSNAAYGAWRILAGIFFATAGLAVIPFFQRDEFSRMQRSLFTAFGVLVIPILLTIPFTHLYLRYFDVPILISLIGATRGLKADRRTVLAAVALAALAVAYVALEPSGFRLALDPAAFLVAENAPS